MDMCRVRVARLADVVTAVFCHHLAGNWPLNACVTAHLVVAPEGGKTLVEVTVFSCSQFPERRSVESWQRPAFPTEVRGMNASPLKAQAVGVQRIVCLSDHSVHYS